MNLRRQGISCLLAAPFGNDLEIREPLRPIGQIADVPRLTLKPVLLGVGWRRIRATGWALAPHQAVPSRLDDEVGRSKALPALPLTNLLTLPTMNSRAGVRAHSRPHSPARAHTWEITESCWEVGRISRHPLLHLALRPSNLAVQPFRVGWTRLDGSPPNNPTNAPSLDATTKLARPRSTPRPSQR